MLMPHLASDKDGPGSSPRAGAVFFDTGAKGYSSFLDHELRRPYFAGFGTKALVNLVSDCVSATGFDGHLYRLLCDTQASLVCESEPLLRVAQTPLPKSSVARLSPSIIFINFKLCVRVAGV